MAKRNQRRGGSVGGTPEAVNHTLWAQRNDDIEASLLQGTNEEALRDYFGSDAYDELRELGQQASRRTVRSSATTPKVLILPGIEGSKIGTPHMIMDDVVWIDPIDILRGNLSQLSLELKPTRHQALGVFLSFYLKLKLRLRMQGFESEFWPYDWRFGVDKLGADLWSYIQKQPGKVQIVCHSMGGLVTRAAAFLEDKAGGPQRIEKVVMLGTPNHGSFLALPSLRGVADFVKMIAAIDPRRTGPELCEQVFNTFPAIYQLLPTPEKYSTIDLFKKENWPDNTPTLRQQHLTGVATARAKLHPTDDRFYLIAGCNQETITNASMKPDKSDFNLEMSRDGDGVVPIDFARIGSVPTYYVEESHGSLANNSKAGAAVSDLLRSGATDVLPTSYTPTRAAPKIIDCSSYGKAPALPTTRSKKQLRVTDIPRDFIRGMAGEFGSAKSSDSADTKAIAVQALDTGAVMQGVVVARRRQHQVNIRLVKGSITGVQARAYVVGTFSGVRPAGAAAAIDEFLRGAIAEFSTRRMYGSEVGEIFLVPAGQSGLQAEFVVLAGLGPFDQFDGQVQKTVAENVMRAMVRSRVSDFATVLFGGGSGYPVRQTLSNLIEGFVTALLDADGAYEFNTIKICESDPEKYEQVRDQLFDLSRSPLMNELAVTFDEEEAAEVRPPKIAVRPLEARGIRAGAKVVTPVAEDRPWPVYLSVRTRPREGDALEMRTSILTAVRPVTITGLVNTTRAAVEKIISFKNTDLRPKDVDQTGKLIAETFLSPSVREVLEAQIQADGGRKPRDLVFVIDPESARVPWETLRLSNATPALVAGMSRSLEADGLSVAKYLSPRAPNERLQVLLIANPTGDLAGAEAEGTKVKSLLENAGYRVDMLRGPEATKEAILDRLTNERYDLMHYAGHAFFDPDNRAAAGILAAEHRVITGPNLAKLAALPAVVVVNACESGRIRGGVSIRPQAVGHERAQKERPDASLWRAEAQTSVAEALLRGGVAVMIGTYWPVMDSSALEFARSLYTSLSRGGTVGESLLLARQSIKALNATEDRKDWADYMMYGDPGLRLTQAREGQNATANVPSAAPTPVPPAAKPAVVKAPPVRPSKKATKKK
ncbi:MAG: CHAT domain-containing protein [Planctomycetes bacterium]|nr:CHAT domain-containing protein [Planctomycetota bacterium]